MTWSRWVSFFMANAAVSATACRPPPDVQVLTESVRLEQSRPSPKASSVFDGRVVRLRGARGETLGLQVRISDGQPRSMRLALPTDAATVSAFSVRSLLVREPSSSMYGLSAGPGTYPDVLVPTPLPVQSSELAYFDVAIPAAAQPGRYDGELLLGERTIPLTLDVARARIDLTKAPLVWVFYLPREIARASGLPDGEGTDLIAKEREYHDIFRAHGAYLASDLPPARFPARRGFVHDVAYWPVAIDTTSDESITKDTRAWLDAFAGSNVTPFAIPVDEPRSEAARKRARHIGEVIGRAGGGRPGLLRGVTDEARPAYGDSMDVFISPANIPAIARQRATGGERFWTYNGRPPQAGSMILDTDAVALRTWGWIAEKYDIELWYAWEGLYFTDRYNGGGPTDVLHDSLTFDERSRGGSDWGNGDGVLVYPGPWPSLRLKALRRGLQDRLLLRELVACGGAHVARDVVNRIVPQALGEATSTPSWPSDEGTWAQARERVLDALDGACP